MSRHPSHIRGAPERVFFFQIEHPFRGDVNAGHVAARRVHDALGFACRTAGVKHEQRMLGIQRLGRTYAGHFAHLVMPPEVPGRSHVHRLTRSLVYDDAFYGRRAGQRLIGILLQRHHRASAIGAVGSNQDAGLGIIDSIAKCFCAEAAKHDIVSYTDTGASQHGDRQFRNHPHVDRRAIAFLDSERLQNIGEAADLVMQHLIADGPNIARLAFPEDREFVFPG